MTDENPMTLGPEMLSDAIRDLSKFQLLLHGLEADIAVFADARGRILYLSPPAEEFFGRSSLSVVGQSLTVLMPTRYHRQHLAGLGRVARTGIEESRVLYRTVRFEALRNDGAELPVNISTAAWRTPAGRLHFVAVLEPVEDTG